MENASKALIMAGAILLAILLISLGIMVFNQTQEQATNIGLDQAQLQVFNNKFIKYEGIISGLKAKSLVNEVIANNNDETTPDITVILGSETIVNDTINKTSGIATNKKYKVEITEYKDGGVSKITLTQQ